MAPRPGSVTNPMALDPCRLVRHCPSTRLMRPLLAATSCNLTTVAVMEQNAAQHAIGGPRAAAPVGETCVEARTAGSTAPVIHVGMLDPPFPRDEPEGEGEHPRSAREPRAAPVAERMSELDDPAGLCEPDAAPERPADLVRAPALEAIDVRVVVKAPQCRHYGLEVSDLTLELRDVAQR